MNESQVTKDFLLIQCLPFFINLIEFEKRYKPKGEIITVVKPYDLRYLMLVTSNNCVPQNIKRKSNKFQDLLDFFFFIKIILPVNFKLLISREKTWVLPLIKTKL